MKLLVCCICGKPATTNPSEFVTPAFPAENQYTYHLYETRVGIVHGRCLDGWPDGLLDQVEKLTEIDFNPFRRLIGLINPNRMWEVYRERNENESDKSQR